MKEEAKCSYTQIFLLLILYFFSYCQLDFGSTEERFSIALLYTFVSYNHLLK